MATLKQQRELLEYVLFRTKEHAERFRKWHEEAAAKAYDMAEAYKLSVQSVEKAEAELQTFLNDHKLL